MRQPLGFLALTHPRTRLELDAKPTQSPLEAGGKAFHAHMVLLSAPRLPQMQPSTMLFPHAIPPSAVSGYHLQFFSLSVKFSIIKTVTIYGTHPMARPCCKARRWLISC